MYEYVAVAWHRALVHDDEGYAAEYDRLSQAGWVEVARAHFGSVHDGGACIMRRPKDQPRMWTEAELRELMKETWVVGGNAYMSEEGQPCDCGCGGRVYHGPSRANVVIG